VIRLNNEVVALVQGADTVERQAYGIAAHLAVRLETRQNLLEAPDVHIIDIATPNDLHAAQAVAAAKAGKHILLEKPTGLNVQELIAIRDAVRAAGVRTIVSFELRYNPWLRFIHWMRESGRLGRVHYARTNYLSRVTDWYSGWEWCRTVKGGGSHLLAAGCHAVDALRWATGLEIAEVSAYHMQVTPGYEWPTTIDVNVRFDVESRRIFPSRVGAMDVYVIG